MSSAHKAGPSRWERRGHRVVNSTKVLDLTMVTYHHPVRGTEREFVRLDAPDWVNVIAVTRDERVVLVRQFRFGTDEFSLELPGGVMEVGEDPVTAGLRELAEETGYGAGRARLLSSVYPNPAIQGNRCHFVLIEDAEEVHPLDWDADEEIELTTASLAELPKLVADGRISHSLSVCAALLYLQSRRSGV